jgi:hypothetical protein
VAKMVFFNSIRNEEIREFCKFLNSIFSNILKYTCWESDENERLQFRCYFKSSHFKNLSCELDISNGNGGKNDVFQLYQK